MSEFYSFADAQGNDWPVLVAMAENVRFPSVTLNRRVCVVGARCLVHFPLPAPTISKAQALIVRENLGVYIRDLASRNQTYINGQPVREAWLNPADEVRFGPFAFTCQSRFEREAESLPSLAAELWLQQGPASREVVAVKERTFLIGSRAGCDLVLDGDEIALAHAIIFERDSRRYLRDLSSITGTLVNGNRIREVELQAGDEIRIGYARIEYYPMEARILADAPASDAITIDFGPRESRPGAFESLPIGAELAQFTIPGVDDPLPAAPLVAAEQIILPWDETAPIELELVDSRTD